ncbi:MAG: hypothetical protein RLZZ299_2545 [Pseudomonadota bacterium]
MSVGPGVLFALIAGDLRAAEPELRERAGTASQEVVLHVSVVDRVPVGVRARVQQAGAVREVELRDDGTDPADVPFDRVWSGTARGDASQYVPVRIDVEEPTGVTVAWDGVVRGGLEPHVELSFEVTSGPDGRMVGRRRATRAPGAMSHAAEALPLLGAAAWAVLLLVVAALAGLRRTDAAEAGGTPPDGPPP